jgi:hypothetical protein
MDRDDRPRPTTDDLLTAAEQRLEAELRVHRLYVDLARWERGERP